MRFRIIPIAAAAFLGWTGTRLPAEQPTLMEDPDDLAIPAEWIDRATGHRVLRLSRGPGQYGSYYFHNNPFFKNDEGDDMMAFNGSAPGDEKPFRPTTQQYWRTPSSNSIYTINLRTGEVRHLAQAPRTEIIGRRSRTAYFLSEDRSSVAGIDLVTGERREIVDLPADDGKGFSLTTINADESLMAGVIVDEPAPASVNAARTKGERMQRTFDAKQMRRLMALDLRTGELQTLLRERTWFGHNQFSPVDPKLLMYCHEGPWHLLERIWTYRVGSGATEGTRLLGRTVDMEIWGHEWWDPSGKVIWFDHQIPKGEKFFVTGVDVGTQERTSYELDRNEWSVHYTISPDGKLFAGDGGSPQMVARAPDGKWIYLFRPNDETHRFEATKLVSMKDHDYSLEPNVHFTPDQKWIVFRSNMHGRQHVYAVEIAKAQ